jgi:hypothetical protein
MAPGSWPREGFLRLAEYDRFVPLPVMLPSSRVATTKQEGALVGGQGWWLWQGRRWSVAPRDRAPGAGGYRWKGD